MIKKYLKTLIITSIMDLSPIIIGIILEILIIFLLVFLPAGTIKFWNGWLFIGILFIPMFFLGILHFYIHSFLFDKNYT